MKSYIWLTFVFMGWGYYEMSGGSDFERETVAMAQAEAPEIVTRADAPTLLSVSSSNVTPQVIEAEIVLALSEAVVLDTAEAEPELVQVASPDIENKLDIREVAGSRVNMRMGPGTGFDVITTLDGGTKLEVLEITSEGWANVSTVDHGIEGWMAERLLTDSNT